MATRNRYFTLLIMFLSLHTLPVTSQQNTRAYLNLITSTLPVLATLSQKNSLFRCNQLMNSFSREKPVSSVYYSGKLIFDACGSSSSGSGDVSANSPNNSITLDPNSKVVDPGNAVDGNLSTWSQLNIMVKQKDVEVVQFVRFTATTSITDVVKLTLSIGETLHNSEVWIQAFNDALSVGTAVDISSTLPVLQINSGVPNLATTKEYTLAPGAIFDRVRIMVIAKDNGNDKALINLHEVSLTPAPATPSTSGGGSTSGGSSSISQCQGSVALSVNNPTSGYVYRWYNASNILQQESTSTTYTPSGLTASATPYVYYLSSARAVGCTVESAKHQINLTVNSRPNAPSLTLNN